MRAFPRRMRGSVGVGYRHPGGVYAGALRCVAWSGPEDEKPCGRTHMRFHIHLPCGKSKACENEHTNSARQGGSETWMWLVHSRIVPLED